ncbi:MAG: DegV family protein [Eubacteriales bacterium]|nr:DegV family protein [Eubacteriales bacterium]
MEREFLKYKIVIDSCGELLQSWKQDPRFVSIPFVMTVDDVDIIDDENFDQMDFLKRVAASPECPKSACPSPESYRMAAQGDAERVYIVTISANLSGSYNSAQLGRSLALEEAPDKKIHVFNSCSASIGETLIAMKIVECEEAGLPFEEIVSTVEAYIESQHTFFVLENLETLRKNGRLSGIKAFVASALKIKPVMGSTPDGSIQQIDQARGINKAMVKMADYVVGSVTDSKERILAISHCNCAQRAQMLKEALMGRKQWKDVVVLDTAGLSSMYANDGGVIVVV